MMDYNYMDHYQVHGGSCHQRVCVCVCVCVFVCVCVSMFVCGAHTAVYQCYVYQSPILCEMLTNLPLFT